MSIIRKRTQINGYLGAYHYESCAKPSYCVEVYKKTCFKTVLLFKYYIVFNVYRTIGVKETFVAWPSVLTENGEVTGTGYRFIKHIDKASLKNMYAGFTS